MSLWTDKEAQEATGGAAQGGVWQAARVEIDSRRVRPGDLFVALAGDRFDGHDFIKDAFAKGAVAALVSRASDDLKQPLIVVSDTLKGLQQLGGYARKRSRAKVVGITGSVGKTSTKEMIRLALSAHGEIFASHGNYNNHIGVPLNLANMPPDVPYAVFEMGMNHAGEIAALTRLVQPQVAVITGVDAVHLEFFSSVEAIADAKAEIFQGVPDGGTAVLPADSPYFVRLQKAALASQIQRVIACGQGMNVDCRLVRYSANACGASVQASIFGKEVSYVLGAIGRHWAQASLFALAVAYALGLDVEKSARALAGFSEPEGRGRIIRMAAVDGEALLVDDSYNASPTSMRAAFAKAAEVWENAGRQGRLLAALGDMLELGSESPALHAGLAGDLERAGFTKVFTAGKAMEALHQALPKKMQGAHAPNAKGLLPVLLQALRKDDVLLVKGSHGSHIYELAAALKDAAMPQAKEKSHAL